MRGAPKTCLGCLSAHSVEPRLRMLLAEDSGTVVMKVDIRKGVCNNSPAEASSSENEWRSRVLLTPSLLCYVDVVVACYEELITRLKLSHVEGYQGAPSLTWADPQGKAWEEEGQ